VDTDTAARAKDSIAGPTTPNNAVKGSIEVQFEVSSSTSLNLVSVLDFVVQ